MPSRSHKTNPGARTPGTTGGTSVAGPAAKATAPARPAAHVTAVTPEALRMRNLVAAFFMLDGFLFANWVVRVPQIKAHVGASPGALGLALLGVSGGAVITMTITGKFCTRYGTRPVSVVTGLLLAVSVALPPLTSSVGALGGVLLILGAGYGGLNVAINSAAVDVTKELDQPIMPMFHAAYSAGGLLGAVSGGVIAEYLSPTWHLSMIGLFGLVMTGVLGVMMLRCPPLAAEQVSRRGGGRRGADRGVGSGSGSSSGSGSGSGSDSGSGSGSGLGLGSGSGSNSGSSSGSGSGLGSGSGGADLVVVGAEGDGASVGASSASDRLRPSRRIRILVFVFGTIALCSAYGEGAMADWGALHLRTDLHTDVGLAAAGYASFSVAMLAGRLSGSWLLARAGRTAVLAGGGCLAAAGMVLAALAPSLPLALIGFVLVGLGLANQFPAAIGQAGALTGPSGVAAASTLGYAGMLAGPPLIGFLADQVGLPIALLSIAVLAAMAAVIAVAAARAEAAAQPDVTDAAPDHEHDAEAAGAGAAKVAEAASPRLDSESVPPQGSSIPASRPKA